MAVTKGNATRISHGSSIMYENNPFELLKALSEQKIPVEIALTSEEIVRSISGADNPFPVFQKYDVPVVLVTESAGLTRIDITNEYVRAAHDYNLSYTDLKTLVRNSLEYSLLPGKSLWKSVSPYAMGSECSDSLTNKKTGLCQKLLVESQKAKKQWDLEAKFIEFERKFSSR
jgi:adenosine deaminase